MTDSFVTNTIKHLLHETHVRKATEHTLNDIVMAVEQCAYESEKEEIQHELQHMKSKYSDEAAKVQNLENTNKVLQAHRSQMRQKANQAKEHFIVDISQVLRESRNIYSLREQLKEMDKKLLLASRLETELLEAKKRVKELERAHDPNKRKQRHASSGDGVKESGVGVGAGASETVIKKIPHNLLVNVDTAFLMGAFSFLSTKDVIYTAQASRYLYKKVDQMFSIGSTLCKPEWAELPAHYTSSPPPAVNEGASSIATQGSSGKKEVIGGGSSNSGIVGLTKTMAEELSKKLSAPELKTILSMMDNQKKLSAQLQVCQEESATAKGKLESTESARDFLIGKLKDAEFAIKSAMAEQVTLQKQAETDHEVIFYLDNQSQGLESENKELRWKCGQLEASLDLLRGSHTHNEKQVLMELNELRDRLEVSESAAKSQKKILVKEVKTLRAQLDSVREERDSYWRKLQVMRETLNGPEGGSGGGDKAATSSTTTGQNKKSMTSKVYAMKASLF